VERCPWNDVRQIINSGGEAAAAHSRALVASGVFGE